MSVLQNLRRRSNSGSRRNRVLLVIAGAAVTAVLAKAGYNRYANNKL